MKEHIENEVENIIEKTFILSQLIDTIHFEELHGITNSALRIAELIQKAPAATDAKKNSVG